MDIQRPASVARQKKMRQIMFAAVGVIVIGVVFGGACARLKPAAPTVERATVWVDTVKRGDMTRNVRGLGTLVPVDEARRMIPAVTQGRVERILIRPGVEVRRHRHSRTQPADGAAGALRRRTATARR